MKKGEFVERGKRIRPGCELDRRWEEWPEMKEEERATNTNDCVWEQFLMDMKNKSNGYFWK
eukprot:8762283-Prorocentrum_lima.AAC.1